MSLPVPQRKRRSLGQGMTEYIIIAFLIGIGTIGLVTLYGDNLRALFGMSAEGLAGSDGVVNEGVPSTNPGFTMEGGNVNPYGPGGCTAVGCPAGP